MDGEIGCQLSWYQPDMPIVNNYLKQKGGIDTRWINALFCLAIGRLV